MTTTPRRAMVVTKSGGPDVLSLREDTLGDPGHGEVLIEVAFSGVNFADLAARAGLYGAAPKPPLVVGFEVSGRVVSAGPDVEHVRPGDRVLAVLRFGGYASHVIARADSTRRIPDGMTLEEAAATPVTYATAWYALTEVARMRKGESVLIHAAAGGVGVAAIQLARHLGLETFGTASSDEKLEFCKGLGLQHGINYAKEDFAERVRALTGGRGVHLVIDSVAGPILKKSYQSLAVGGMVIVIGAADLYPRSVAGMARTVFQLARMKRFSALELVDSNRCIAGLQLLLVWDDRGSLGTMFDDLLGLHDQGVVRPVIDRILPLAAAAEAHRYLAARRTKGKVLLDATR